MKRVYERNELDEKMVVKEWLGEEMDVSGCEWM